MKKIEKIEKNYYVYKHTFPNGKVYIGITSLKPEHRWNNGNGYLKKTKDDKYDQPLMAYAINKYGWDNIKHEILFKGLSKEEAEGKEIELIEQYKSNKKEFGYNFENGGNVRRPKNIVFSETKEVERVLVSGKVTKDNIITVIDNMARYNLNIKNMSDKDNCNNIIEWLKIYHMYYVEPELYNVIQSKIIKAHENKFYSVNLTIYKSELDKILLVEDVRYEKILFVILCIAKLQHDILGYQYGIYELALTNIFKFARVYIESTNRNMFIQELINKGYIDVLSNVDVEYKCALFISNGKNDEEVLHIDEKDFAELAYVYESWKSGGIGFTRCSRCRKLILQSKTRPKKYCDDCAKEVNKQKSREYAARRKKEKFSRSQLFYDTIQN